MKYRILILKKIIDMFSILAITLIIVLVLSLIYKFFFIKLSSTNQDVKKDNIVEESENNSSADNSKDIEPNIEKTKNKKNPEIIEI